MEVENDSVENMFSSKKNWLVSTHLKNILVKMEIFPKDEKKYLKAPPRKVFYTFSLFYVTFIHTGDLFGKHVNLTN